MYIASTYVLQHPLGEISLHEARVEEVERSCDSDSDDTSMPDYTLAVWPPSESPTYLMITTRPEKVRGHSVMSMPVDSFLFFWTLISTGSSQNCGWMEGYAPGAFMLLNSSVLQNNWLCHVRGLCFVGELAVSLDRRLWRQRRQ